MVYPTFTIILSGAVLTVGLLAIDWFLWSRSYLPDFRRQPDLGAEQKRQAPDFKRAA